MKNIFKLSISVFFLIVSIKTYSQLSALTFVQNKGQWKGDFEFKSSYGGGAIFIEKKGFTIVQYNSEEVAGVFGHGHKKIASKDKQPDIYRADFVKDESNDSAKKSRQIHMHAYNMRFLGASAMTEFVAEKPTGEESNYFLGNDSTKWQRGIKNYLNVLQKNIYPGIDIRYYSYGGRLKYDFIVQPGADPSRILMKYDGVDGMRIKNKELVLETSLGVSKELSPYSYQIVDGTKKEIGCSYTLQGNIVRFNVDRYDGRATLVIDPILELATFTGSSADNWGFSAAPGPDGSLYAAGIVFGVGYIVTPGAIEFNGGANWTYTNYPSEGEQVLAGVDIGFTRFSPNGSKKIYSTYLGGYSNEFPHSIYVNSNSEAFLMGNTYSKVDFPNTAQFGDLGASDLFVTKFSATGNVIKSVIIGGSSSDGENVNGEMSPKDGTLKLFYGDNSRSEIILDDEGNPIIAASSYSLNFPIERAYQSNINGKQDGVLFKLDANLTSLLFSTFVGGSEDDAAFSLAENPVTKNIFISGVTKSADLKVNSSNAFGNKFNGGSTDGFISEFTADGQWVNGIFIGTPKVDFIYGIQFDPSGYPYIMGVTYGDWTIKHISPTDFEIKGTKQFISKLNLDLTGYVYSTVFGATGVTTPSLVPVAFMVDRCENVYLSGWGEGGYCTTQQGTRDFPRIVKNGSFISSITQSDGRDFYFFALEKDGASQLYGEFYGQYGGAQDHVDGGTSRFDKNGVIYQAICANCGGDSECEGVTTTYATLRNSVGKGAGSCNLFAVKIDFQLSGVAAGIKTSIDGVPYDTSGCAPLSVQFSDTIGIAKIYEWDFDDGTPPVVGTASSQSHTFPYRPTPYHVKLTASDPDRLCQPIDIKFVDIITGTDKVTLKAEATRNDCTSSTFTFTNTSTSETGKPFAPNSFIWNWSDGSPLETTDFGNVTHTFPSSQGTRKVFMRLNDGSFCNNQDSIPILVNLSGIVKAAIDGPKLGCIDETTGSYLGTFKSVGEGGQFFEWSVDGVSIGGLTPSKTVFEYAFTGEKTYTIGLHVVDPAACPNQREAFADSTFTIMPSPKADFSYLPKPSKENAPTRFTNNSSGADAAQPYKWYFGDGVQSEDESPTHLYNYTNKYEVTLIAKNKYGCTASHIDSVFAIVFPLADVPNAFIPNSEGINRTVKVQGFGIAKMDFRIYNRWGQLVFASSSPSYGWDGKYKGVLQPMDVYAYTLQVKFSDGTQVSKKGDITLIR